MNDGDDIGENSRVSRTAQNCVLGMYQWHSCLNWCEGYILLQVEFADLQVNVYLYSHQNPKCSRNWNSIPHKNLENYQSTSSWAVSLYAACLPAIITMIYGEKLRRSAE